jgi:hypothetical protein
MKIIEFDDEGDGKRAAPDAKPSARKIKILEFGKESLEPARGAPPGTNVGKIKIRQFGDEPARQESPLHQAAAKPPAAVKIVEFDKQPRAKAPSAARGRNIKIIESD